MTRLLVSIRSMDEAVIALDADADIIDLKEPEQGALGAMPSGMAREVVSMIGGRKPVSATIGDLPMEPKRLVCGVEHTLELGVDIVKVGFFGSDRHLACVQALQPLAAQGKKIVAVLFANQFADFSLIPKLGKAGFHGVMLDTSDKSAGTLTDHMTQHALQAFIALAASSNLECGLAGSLRLTDIPMLAELRPGYLGFRGALCVDSRRTGKMERERVQQAGKLLRESNKMYEYVEWA